MTASVEKEADKYSGKGDLRRRRDEALKAQRTTVGAWQVDYCQALYNGVDGGKETRREGAGGITPETIQELDNDAWLRNRRG